MEQEQRCKNCGAPLTVSNHSRTVECDHCGSVFELDDNRSQFVNLYAQGDDAWGRKDFDEAIKAYQQIVDEDYAQSEAHWGVAMCRYGIAYELDPIKYVEMPTCNRINRDSILNDKNYLAAVKYAGERAKAVYTQRAQEIDRISKEFLKIVDKEKPYDVFISYKRTDAEGRRTIDSQIAKKLYLFLTEQKINVFFAEETLRDVGGERYEPYIFAALNSAKVMILFGSCKEHINATWVKNEWRRFLILSENDPKKVLIPVFIGRDPYQIMPQELLSIQAYDAASPVFHEEITENIKKKMGDKAPAPKSGNSLEERYAQPEKVKKLMEELDCEERFAIDVLMLKQGNLAESRKYICEDSAYNKALWNCVECGTRNTHGTCRKCQLSKADSNRLLQMQQAEKDRAQRQSAAYKYKRKQKAKNAFATIAVLAVVAALVYAVYNFIIFPNMSIKDGNYYTPQIVQTYCYNYENNTQILTITECAQDGQVTAVWEFIADGAYGKVNLSGKIIDKKNNGEVVIEWTQQTPEVLPANYTWENLSNTTIKKGYEKATGSGNGTMYAGSSEELENLFIKTPADLQKLANSKGFFMLANDLDMTGVTHTPIEGFEGTLMGNNHVIKNLTIDTNSSNVGLFGTTTGTISNLTIENASVTVGGRNENIGILCGTFNGAMSNIQVSGTVNAPKCTYVGGLCGLIELQHETVFNNLTNNAPVTGLSYVGGIAGKLQYISPLTLDSLTNSGVISAEEDYVGGIAGDLSNDGWGSDTIEIQDCSNTGDISGRYYVAGIAGRLYATTEESVMRNASNAAQITGDAYVGGLAGYIRRIAAESCQNSGTTFVVTGSITKDGKRYAYVGGFFGHGEYISISDCTNEASINYTGGGMDVGGIIGCSGSSGVYKNVANNANISGADNVGGISGYIGGSGTSVESATNTGSVTGGNWVGGIVGEFVREGWGDPIHMYDSTNSGNIKGASCVGGLIGAADVNDSSTLNNSSSTGSVSGKDKTGKLVGDKSNLTINENG